MRLLIDAGASLDAVDAEGATALLHAASEGHARICSLLLALGTDVTARDKGGCTALHVAALEGNVSAIEVLVRGGAKLNDAANAVYLALATPTRVLPMTALP